ncbi:MAG: glycerol kinase, partial [Solirubrobacteraceae bacterium]|nr:glycerol kinase [Solirubrobacteraceae bacterium]
MPKYVAAIDQGTTSTRCILFDTDGEVVYIDQREHEQITPKAGWVEHDALDIVKRTRECIGGALASSPAEAGDVAAIGITNQRETTVVWDRETGEPVCNAIVWQDTRTDQIARELGGDEGPDRLREATGLPLSTYFAGPKVKWILDNVDGAREKADDGQLLFGTMDTWTLWNLTGGKDGGVHATDVTNASRTLLMDLETLEWREDHCELMGIPMSMLPEIRSSSEAYGEAKGTALGGVPIAGILGDQHAALFGQAAFAPGDAKNTYGTGSFLLVNTGEEIVRTEKLLTTVGYKIGDAPATYVLEGSIAVTGALIQWLRDRLKIIDTAEQVEALAKTVDDNGGVYFVPAFSGLFAPYWRDDARGAIMGLTAYNNRGHIARAALEAAAWQSREVVDAANEAADVPFTELRVDGGMTANELLMQFQ